MVREEHILNTVITKSTESSLRGFNRLCRKAFACEVDAQKSVEEWQKEQEFTTLSEVAIFEEKNVPNEEEQILMLLILLNFISQGSYLPHYI